MRSRTFWLACLLLLSLAPSVHAKSYTADRFDARIRVLRGGAVEVTETVVFRFDGTFREVFRQIPRRMTDGIEIRRASMDGESFSVGKAPGQYDLANDNGLRVRWHFAPVSTSLHTFELTYVARGVVRQSDTGDLFEWRALPSRHDYSVAASAITIELPAAPAMTPSLRSNRVAASKVTSEDTSLVISASGIRSNGWVEASVLLPPGSVIEAPPAWQARAIRARALAPTWLMAGLGALIVGLVILFAVRQGYDSPVHESTIGPTGPDLPDNLPPAMAGTLVSNGRAGLEQAMATLFTLAERGELRIVENPKRWGQRTFEVNRTSLNRPRAEYEQVVLDDAFAGRDGADSVDLGRARARITRRIRRFSTAVHRQMITDGLIDEGRLAVRRRFAGIAMGAFLLAGLAVIPAAIVIDDYGPWSMIVPAAIAIVAAIALIMYGAHTPLSDEGIRRARGWRGFQKFLRQVIRDRASVPDALTSRILPFAVATGLASGWSGYLKKHSSQAPAWFHAAASDHGAQGFAYFVAIGGSGPATHGAGAAGGGAAGGGASGAH